MQSKENFYPLLCKPVLKSKIWGGRKINELFDIELPQNEKIGEAWMVADLREGSSEVVNGIFAGRTLSEITKILGNNLIGEAWVGKPTGGRFPLLIKFLDAQDDLSIQVHPDDNACKTDFLNDFSKDENWVILHSEEGGHILHGFNKGIQLSDYDDLLKKDKVEECIRSVDVSAGDVIRVSPGTVHALCKGVSILEIQEPSDSTFRIYDYGRLGDDGKPRQLHIEAARKVMKFGDDSPAKIQTVVENKSWGKYELLVDVPACRIERAVFQKDHSWSVNPKSVQVMIIIDGELNLSSNGESLHISKGNCVILPSAIANVSIELISKTATCVFAGAYGIEMIG